MATVGAPDIEVGKYWGLHGQICRCCQWSIPALTDVVYRRANQAHMLYHCSVCADRLLGNQRATWVDDAGARHRPCRLPCTVIFTALSGQGYGMSLLFRCALCWAATCCYFHSALRLCDFATSFPMFLDYVIRFHPSTWSSQCFRNLTGCHLFFHNSKKVPSILIEGKLPSFLIDSSASNV